MDHVYHDLCTIYDIRYKLSTVNKEETQRSIPLCSNCSHINLWPICNCSLYKLYVIRYKQIFHGEIFVGNYNYSSHFNTRITFLHNHRKKSSTCDWSILLKEKKTIVGTWVLHDFVQLNAMFLVHAISIQFMM